MKIIGLEYFGVYINDLANRYANKKLYISIHFSNYPNVESLKPLTPPQRRKIVCKYLRDQLKVIKEYFSNSDFQIKGSRYKPRGITGQLTGHQLVKLQSNNQIKCIVVEQVEGRKKIKNKISSGPIDSMLSFYYSAKGLFVAQSDGLDATRKSKLTEERILLIKALDWNEAINKARVEFENYGQQEILSSNYHFVRWKFLKIVDVYDMGVTVTDYNINVTEVYCIRKRRQLRASDYNKPILFENF